MESTDPSIERLVLDLSNFSQRENALLLQFSALRNVSKGGKLLQHLPRKSVGTIASLLEGGKLLQHLPPMLCKSVDIIASLLEGGKLLQHLPPMLCKSVGTIASLLEVIVSAYPWSELKLNFAKSSLVCNSLTLLKCVASHPDTQKLFLNADMHLYVYPLILYTTGESRLTEYLRLTSLGLIGALMMDSETEVIRLLLATDIIPLCLRTMKMGTVFSKTAASFIVQRILLHEEDLNHICKTRNLVSVVGQALGIMVEALAEQADKPSSLRLLKDIIRCYLLVLDNPGACDALKICLPSTLKDGTFSRRDHIDEGTQRWLRQSLLNVGLSAGSLRSPGPSLSGARRREEIPIT